MKILHCADIHLGKKPFGSREYSKLRYLDYFKAFDEIVEKAINLKVNLMIIGGDLFDKKELTPDILNRTEKIFIKLKEKGIKVFLIEGNHDNITGYDEVNSWLNYLEKKEYVMRGKCTQESRIYKFEKTVIEGINFYGVGYSGYDIDEIFRQLSLEINPEEKNIVVAHTGFGDGEFLPGLVSTESIKLFKDKVIYFAGGHLHSFSSYPKEKPYFFVPGSLEYCNIINERKKEKGAILFDTDSLEFEFIEVTPRKKLEFKLEYSYDFEEEFEKFIISQNLTGEELVVVYVVLKTSTFIDTGALEEILEKNGALKGFIKIIYEDDKREIIENYSSDYTIMDMEKTVIDSWRDFKNKDEVFKYLQEFKDYQEEKREKADFITLFDMMLEGELESENK